MQEGFASYPEGSFEELVRKIEADMPNLPKQEAKVAQYILLNLDSISFETGRTISQKARVSEITVGRVLRRFGCAGMKEFKALLRQRYSIAGQAPARKGGDLSERWRDQLGAEIEAVQSIYDLIEGEDFLRAQDLLAGMEEVFVTGFQTVRGLAEDSARRLALARPDVRFLSAHDSMLSEWIGSRPRRSSCVLLIDVVPYAAESLALAALAKEQGRKLVVVTDEYCHWAREFADAVINAPSATGLFLESTLGLNAALALLIHGVANSQPDAAAERLREWKGFSRQLKLF